MEHQKEVAMRKANEAKLAMREMQRDAESTQTVEDEVSANEKSLREKSDSVQVAEKAARGAVDSMKLTQLTMSPENLLADDKMDELEAEIHASMPSPPKAGSSLLQEGMAYLPGVGVDWKADGYVCSNSKLERMFFYCLTCF